MRWINYLPQLILFSIVLSSCRGAGVALYEVRGLEKPPYCRVTFPDKTKKNITIEQCDKIVGMNASDLQKTLQKISDLVKENAELKKRLESCH